jgi:hypothetical protein
MESNENKNNNGAKELDPNTLADLFQLETLAPPGESSGWSCCQIMCWVKK